MQINWDLIGKTPVLLIRHIFSFGGEEQVNFLAKRLASHNGSHENSVALVDKLIKDLFQSSVIRFEEQKVDCNNGVLIAHVITAGEAYDIVEMIERVIKMALSMREQEFDIKNIIATCGFEDVLKKQRKTQKYVIEGFRRGFDVLKKGASADIIELRNNRGYRMALLRQFTDKTSHIATQIATRKGLTMEVLHLAGLPVPTSMIVRSPAEAIAFCHRLLPKSAVVKPANTDWGIAVSTGLRDAIDIKKAFHIAARYGEVLAQEHIEGDDYRLLVIDGVVAGVTHREAFSVTGNGHDTVRELAISKLIDRSKNEFYKDFMNIDIEAPETALTLNRQGLSLQDKPEKGVKIRLRDNSNVSSGGEHREVTDICHPDNIQLALDATNVVGLDLAGIDLLSRDITVSWKSNGAKICEINPSPAVSVDIAPDLLFRRISNIMPVGNPQSECGDKLFITNKTERGSMMPHLFDQDLDSLTERQYFYQSYLTKGNRNLRLHISFDRLMHMGCPNKNVTKAFCSSELGDDAEALHELKCRLPPRCKIEFG